MATCPQCGNTYANRWNLARHVTNFHPKTASSENGFGDTYSELHSKPTSGDSSHQYGEGDVERQQCGAIPMETVHNEDIESEDGSDSVDSYEHEANTIGGRKRKRSNKDLEEESDHDDIPGGLDIFTQPMDEESDSDSSSNPSSDDSDDCESSSEYSSENEEEVTNDGAQPREIAEGEEEEPQKPQYLSFARWRDPDNGVYTGWKSFNRKPHVVQHREWLNKLLKPPYKLQKALIKEASDPQLDAFREIALNVLQGRTAMPSRTFRGLGKYKAAIQKLASEDSDYYTLRRTLLAGRSDILPILLLHATPRCIKSPKVVERPEVTDEFDE